MWQITQRLMSSRRGRTVSELAQEFQTSIATVHRDIKELEAAGVPIQDVNVTGTRRYRVSGDGLPPLRVTQEQFSALLLAREYLKPLAGTSLYDGVDTFIQDAHRSAMPHARPAVRKVGATGAETHAGMLGTLERAINDRRRVEISYRGSSDGAHNLRRVEPLRLLEHDAHVYLVAFDLGPNALRTFKAARMKSARLLSERSQPRSVDVEKEMEQSVGIWTGKPVTVTVFIHEDVARFVDEWKLCSWQRVDASEGGVVVSAEVAGTMDVFRWVLRWGRNAEVLAPPELRTKVRDELLASAARYG